MDTAHPNLTAEGQPIQWRMAYPNHQQTISLFPRPGLTAADKARLKSDMLCAHLRELYPEYDLLWDYATSTAHFRRHDHGGWATQPRPF